MAVPDKLFLHQFKQFDYIKRRFVGKLLLDKFTGLKEEGQGNHHGKREREEREGKREREHAKY